MIRRNPEFVRSKEETFFKILLSVDSSENMHLKRALPHDFTKSFSNKELSGRKMKIRAQWGSSWEVGVSKNPRFYFMEKSGWEKFVSDNALGHSEFITFTHKGKMRFTVNIFKQDGKEMMQPPSLIKTDHVEDDKKEEVVVSTDLSRGTRKRKLNLGKKKAEESKNFTRTEKVVRVRRDSGGASSSSVAEFTVIIRKTYLKWLKIPKDHRQKAKKAIFKIHHSNGRKTWDVVVCLAEGYTFFSGGWAYVVKEYPIAVDDICTFTFIKPDELILVVSKP